METDEYKVRILHNDLLSLRFIRKKQNVKMTVDDNKLERNKPGYECEEKRYVDETACVNENHRPVKSSHVSINFEVNGNEGDWKDTNKNCSKLDEIFISAKKSTVLLHNNTDNQQRTNKKIKHKSKDCKGNFDSKACQDKTQSRRRLSMSNASERTVKGKGKVFAKKIPVTVETDSESESDPVNTQDYNSKFKEKLRVKVRNQKEENNIGKFNSTSCVNSSNLTDKKMSSRTGAYNGITKTSPDINLSDIENFQVVKVSVDDNELERNKPGFECEEKIYVDETACVNENHRPVKSSHVSINFEVNGNEGDWKDTNKNCSKLDEVLIGAKKSKVSLHTNTDNQQSTNKKIKHKSKDFKGNFDSKACQNKTQSRRRLSMSNASKRTVKGKEKVVAKKIPVTIETDSESESDFINTQDYNRKFEEKVKVKARNRKDENDTGVGVGASSGFYGEIIKTNAYDKRILKLMAEYKDILNKIEKTEMRDTGMDGKKRISHFVHKYLLQRKRMKVWNELWMLYKTSGKTRLLPETFSQNHDSRSPDVSEVIGYFRDRKTFPVYNDLRELVVRINKDHSLGLSDEEIDSLSRDIFSDVENHKEMNRHIWKDFTTEPDSFMASYKESSSNDDQPNNNQAKRKKKTGTKTRTKRAKSQKMTEKYPTPNCCANDTTTGDDSEGSQCAEDVVNSGDHSGHNKGKPRDRFGNGSSEYGQKATCLIDKVEYVSNVKDLHFGVRQTNFTPSVTKSTF